MSLYEKENTKMILEISNFVYQNGYYPPRGTLSSDHRDMSKALTRYRTGEVFLTEEQVQLLAALDDFLTRTEKNIQEIESFYEKNRCLPTGEKERLVGIIGDYKSGKIPITLAQKKRLENIGAFKSNTERMVCSIESFVHHYGKQPKRGDKTPEGYDMGDAIIGYRNGKRALTLNQRERLEIIGISLPNAKIKEEFPLKIRIAKEPGEQRLSERIKKLKQERESLKNEISEKKRKL